MKLKKQIRLVGEWAERNITEYLHWAVAFAPIVVAIVGTLIGSVSHIPEVALSSL